MKITFKLCYLIGWIILICSIIYLLDCNRLLHKGEMIKTEDAKKFAIAFLTSFVFFIIGAIKSGNLRKLF